MGPYVDALKGEISLWGDALDHPGVSTIFFGGGTPSYLAVDRIRELLHAVGQAFPVASGAETTLEANPGDLTTPALAALLSAGANRLSIGVQSLDDGLLELLGRRHTAQQAVAAYELAREAGFQRLNLDLMYGLPRQSFDQWRDTLERTMDLEPPHLSLYCLTLEEGTPLERWVSQGALPQPDPDLAADMYSLAIDSLAQAGYHHYEISNWARPGQECLHNLAYWRGTPYLGVGPGAHSYLLGHRFWAVDSPRTYIQRVAEWGARSTGLTAGLTAGLKSGANGDPFSEIPPVAGVEAIGRELAMGEAMMLGLRLLDDLSPEEFRGRFGVFPRDAYGPQIDELVQEGLLEETTGVLRLTRRGTFLANQVFLRFLD